MLSRFLRPTGSSLCAKLVRCISGEAAAPQVAAVDHVGRLSEEVFQREQKYGAHNYHPLPVALCKAEGESTLRTKTNLHTIIKAHSHRDHNRNKNFGVKTSLVLKHYHLCCRSISLPILQISWKFTLTFWFSLLTNRQTVCTSKHARVKSPSKLWRSDFTWSAATSYLHDLHVVWKRDMIWSIAAKT